MFHIFELEMHFFDWNFLENFTTFLQGCDALSVKIFLSIFPYRNSILNVRFYFYTVPLLDGFKIYQISEKLKLFITLYLKILSLFDLILKLYVFFIFWSWNRILYTGILKLLIFQGAEMPFL